MKIVLGIPLILAAASTGCGLEDLACARFDQREVALEAVIEPPWLPVELRPMLTASAVVLEERTDLDRREINISMDFPVQIGDSVTAIHLHVSDGQGDESVVPVEGSVTLLRIDSLGIVANRLSSHELVESPSEFDTMFGRLVVGQNYFDVHTVEHPVETMRGNLAITKLEDWHTVRSCSS